MFIAAGMDPNQVIDKVLKDRHYSESDFTDVDINRINRKVEAIYKAVNNNDEADATILGFKHVKIFKKWRDEKYKPLDDMRKTIAESKDPQTGEYIYGGLKLVEDVYGMGDIDKDSDGQVDDEEEPKEVTVYEFPIMGYKNKTREGIIW